jgi:hypothetical protein
VIFFVASADQAGGMEEYLRQHGDALGPRLRIVTYDHIVAHPHLRLGTYIFAAVDQLCPTETELAAQCCDALSRASPAVRLLNPPAGVLSRYELLRTCFELKRNPSTCIAPRSSIGVGDFRSSSGPSASTAGA